MTEQELDTLEQIWKGKTSWGPESEQALENLAAGGYIEIAEKRRAARAGQAAVDEILVRITDEGIGHLGSSAY